MGAADEEMDWLYEAVIRYLQVGSPHHERAAREPHRRPPSL
jgi:hypothetical protein